MHDLRKQALSSGKTVSRKAKSHASSTASSRHASPAISRTSSRAGSAGGSSDEESQISESTVFSADYLDDDTFLGGEEEEVGPNWVQSLEDQMALIIDTKHSSVQGREQTLGIFNAVLASHYAAKIKRNVQHLLPPLLRSVKSGASEQESALALRAIALVVVTAPEEGVYDAVADALVDVIRNSQSASLKAAAIHAQGVATFYGGASEDETIEVMAQLLEIVESDGASVEAEDSGDVVLAALEEWGFLATQLEDLEDISQEAAEAMTEQLDSTNAPVQLASGENLVLLSEASFREADSDEDEAAKFGQAKPVRAYGFYAREHLVKQKMEDLGKASAKWMSKRDRKALHYGFTDMLDTLEHGTGPRQRFLDPGVSRPMTVRMGSASELVIDTWVHYHRLKALRRVLQSGLKAHYSDNPVIFETIPLEMNSTADVRSQGRAGKPRASGRMAKGGMNDDDDV